MPPVILFVPNQMFPITPLPYSPLPLRNPARMTSPAAGNSARESRPDQGSPHRIGATAHRQGPHGVKVIGKDHGGIDGKRMLRHYLPHCAMKGIRVVNRRRAVSPGKVNRKKVSSPGYAGTSVSHPLASS